MNNSLSRSGLIALLYLLMRDAAPTSAIVSACRASGPVSRPGQAVYSCKELQAYAERLADEMLHEQNSHT